MKYLDVIEKDFGPSAVKGINAGTGRTASAALEAEQISVESIASQRPQWPMHWNFTFLIQDQIRVTDFQLASTQAPSRVVHIHHLHRVAFQNQSKSKTTKERKTKMSLDSFKIPGTIFYYRSITGR